MQIVIREEGHDRVDPRFRLVLQGFIQRCEQLCLQINRVRGQEVVAKAVAAGPEQGGQNDQDGKGNSFHSVVSGMSSRALSRSALLKSSAILTGSRPGM